MAETGSPADHPDTGRSWRPYRAGFALGTFVALAALFVLQKSVIRMRLFGPAMITCLLLLIVLVPSIHFTRCRRCGRLACLEPNGPSPHRPFNSATRTGIALWVLVPLLLFTALPAVASRLVADVTIHSISVEQVARMQGTQNIVSLRGGRPRTDLTGTFIREAPGSGNSKTGGATRLYVQIVPYVPEGWTVDQPVDIWIICNQHEATGTCKDPMRFHSALDAYGRGEPLRPGRVEPYQRAEEAVADATRKHGVRSAPKAVFVRWPFHEETL